MTRHWTISGKVPPIKSVMTPFPYSIEIEGRVAEALALMREHQIRHLPVKQGPELVGMLSERDALRVDEKLPVTDVMRRDPFVVDTERPLDDVLLQLVSRHEEGALVVRDGRLAGIFTATDGCRLLGEALSCLSVSGSGGEIA